MKKIVFSIIIISTILLSVQMQLATMKPTQFEALFQKKIVSFEKALHSFEKDPSTQNYLNVRKAFKQAEFLYAYLDPAFYKTYINGAPLPTLMEGMPDLTIKQPHGLQIIDELMTDPSANSDEVQLEIKGLKTALHDFEQLYAFAALYERQIFEASRKEIIRLVSMNLTGFDTPAVGNKYKDSYNSLVGPKEFVEHMNTTNQTTTKIKKKVLADFSAAQRYIQSHASDETFNHFHFYKTYAQPLYSSLLDLHVAMNVETINEVSPYEQPFNYQARELFSDDFLNPSFFITEVTGEDMNKVTELGAILFFDPIMSANNKRSCASCHNPKIGFSDGLPKSLAFDFEGTVNRNSPGLINSVFASHFFWDMRAKELEKQMKHVVFSEKEFNTSFLAIIEKLNSSDEYIKFFSEAFPNYEEKAINRTTISRALSAYIGSLTSFNSDFDKAMRSETILKSDAIAGYNLFMGKAACGTCHFAPTFSGLVPPDFKETEGEVLGVTASSDLENPVLDEDPGRIESGFIREKAPHYYRAFKTVSIRNASLTAPYMHNGAFETLEQVVEFYNRGGGAGLGLDVEHQTLAEDPLNLTENEKMQLVSFMQSLTDTSLSSSPNIVLPSFKSNVALNNRKAGGDY